MSHNLTHRCHNSILPYLALFFCGYPLLLVSPRAERKKKRGTSSDPPPKWGGMTPIAVLSHIPLSGPMRVALVLIYPCGKARSSPPGGALKERETAL